jgi:hypothetical protein
VDYYTSNLSILSVRSLWKIVKRSSPQYNLLARLIIVLAVRLRRRPSPEWALPRPETLLLIPLDAMPEHVRGAMHSTMAAGNAAGFQAMFFAKSPFIGARQGYTAVLLNSAGNVFASIVWMRFDLLKGIKENIRLACHSCFTNGDQWHTGAAEDLMHLSQIIPPNHKMLALPLQSTPQQIIDAHCQRIAAAAGLIRFDRDSLIREQLKSIQQLFDHQVAKGYYVPISPDEVDRLIEQPLEPETHLDFERS